MSHDLSCRELVELVTDYLDGAQTPGDRARFEEHMLTCPACHRHIDQMRGTILLVGRLPEQSLSNAAEQELLEAFRGWRAG